MSHARNRVPHFAEAAVERARLTVVPRRATTAPKVPFVALVSLLLVGGVVGLLLFNTNMQQSSFTATEMENTAAVLDAREQGLQMQLDTLRDPQRVAVRAQRLGMVPASSPAFIRLSDGTVLGNPTVAESTDSMRIAPLPTRKPKSLRPDPVIVEPRSQKPARKKKPATTPAARDGAGEAGQQDNRRRRGRSGR
jgi:hypothetical protein